MERQHKPGARPAACVHRPTQPSLRAVAAENSHKFATANSACRADDQRCCARRRCAATTTAAATKPSAATLNAAQRSAVVSSLDAPLAVVAGAGSGKTSVLTKRIQHALASGVKPTKLLALTFTKAAAEEMRGRLVTAVGQKTAPRPSSSRPSTRSRSRCAVRTRTSPAAAPTLPCTRSVSSPSSSLPP